MAETDDGKVLKMSLFCTLCLQKLNKPRTLPCYHIFCESCLNNYFVNAPGKDNASKDGIPCPTCKVAISPPKSALPVREWAENFPLNHLVGTLINIVPVSSRLEFCEPCKDNKESKIASFMCQQCAETMCEECTKCHQTMKATKCHVIIPLENARSSFQLSIPTDEVLCSDHKKKDVDIYCKDHKQLGCSICIATNHTKCDQDFQISEIVGNETPSDTDKLLKDIDKLITDAENVKRERQEIIQGTTIKKTKMLQDIGDTKRTLTDHFEKLESQVKGKFNDISTKDFVKIQEQIEFCNSVQTAMNHSKADIKSAQDQKAKTKEFIAVQQGNKKYKSSVTGLKQIIESSTKSLYLLEEDAQLAETLDTLCILGKQELKDMYSHRKSDSSPQQAKSINVKDNQSKKTVKNTKADILDSLEVPSKQKTGVDEQQTQKAVHIIKADSSSSLDVLSKQNVRLDEDQSKKAVKKTKTFNAKVRGDKKDCRITAIRMLRNAQMLLADNANVRLKLFGEFGDLICTFNCTHPPWDFTFVGKDRFAVTFPNERKIRLFLLDETLTETGYILALKGCNGICMAGEDLAVTISSSCVRILALDGTVKMMIDTDFIGKRLFSNPEFITFNPIISCLYVSDYNNHSVTALHYDNGTVDKTPLFVYPVSGPRGVCVDSKGTLYVCGFWSNAIHKVNDTGGIMQVLVDGLARPSCLAINEAGDKLALSEQGNPNIIKIFRIVEASEVDDYI